MALGEWDLGSGESRRRLDVESDVDDCRRFGGGDLGGSISGRTTADAIGLQFS
jgi:hypothetical protein